MLDSTGRERQFAITPRVEPRNGCHRGARRFYLPLWSSRRDWSGWPRRAALRLDRTRHGHLRRLGHAPPLRPAMVREANSLLLARGPPILVGPAPRVGRAAPLVIRCPRRRPRNRLAGLEALRN